MASFRAVAQSLWSLIPLHTEGQGTYVDADQPAL